MTHPQHPRYPYNRRVTGAHGRFTKEDYHNWLIEAETELNPSDHEPHLYLAAVYQAIGQHRQTQQHLEQADELRVYPVRLSSRVQAEIHTQVMRAQAMQRTVSKKKRWRFWKR